MLRQLAADLSIHAGHQLNDNYLATLGSSMIKTAVYQGLSTFSYRKDSYRIDTGQDSDFIYSFTGFKVLCVW